MDPQPPTGVANAPLRLVRTHMRASTRMYGLQVRAFIEATESVDTDPDVIEDILDGFDPEILDSDDDEGNAQDAEKAADGEHAPEEHAGDDSEEEEDADDEFQQYLEEGLLGSCIMHVASRLDTDSPFVGLVAQVSWTTEQVKAMIDDLKENGNSSAPSVTHARGTDHLTLYRHGTFHQGVRSSTQHSYSQAFVCF